MATNDSGKQYFGIGLDLNEMQIQAEQAKNILAQIGSDATQQGALIDQAFGQNGAALGLDVASASASDLEAHIETLGSALDAVDSVIGEQELAFNGLKKEEEDLLVTLSSLQDKDSDEADAMRDRIVVIQQEEKARQSLISSLATQSDAIVAQIDVETKKLEELKAETEKVSEASKTHESILVKMLGGNEQYKAILGALPGPLKSVFTGIQNMTKAGLAFIATPLGATIGAITLALMALKKWFDNSRTGQEALTKVTGYFQGVLDELGKVVMSVGEFIYNAFTDPKQAVIDLWNIIKTNLLNRVKGLGGVFVSFGEILKNVFELNWDEVGNSYKKLADNVLMAITGVEDAANKATNAFKKIGDGARSAAEASSATLQLERDRAEWEAERENTQTRINELTIQARDTSKSQKELKAIQKERQELVDKVVETEKGFAQRQKEIAESEVQRLGEDNKQAHEQLLEANKAVADANKLEASLKKGGVQVGNRVTSVSARDDKAAAKAASDAEKQAQREAKAEQQRQEALTKIDEQLLQMRDKNQKSEVSIMKEGTDKKLAQITADYDAQMTEIIKKENELKKLNQKAGLETNEDGLTEEQYLATTKMRENAEKEYENSLQELLDSELQSIMTYEQKRQKIEEEYADKRKALYQDDGVTLREGVTQGNVSNLDQQENQALEALDAEVLAKQENFEAWTAMISQLALEQLEVLLSEAEAQLEAAKENGASAEDVALAQAQVNALNKQVEKMKTSPQQSSVNDWTKLYKTLQTCEREFERVGDAIGGTAGTIVKTAGQIASAVLSAFNGVEELFSKTDEMLDSVQKVGESTTNVLSETAEGASTAMQTAGKGAATAISTVEKASVILTIISAALQVAMAIVNLFNNDNKYEKEIEELQRRIDQLQWELDNSGAVRIQNQLGDALTAVRDIYNQVTDEVLKLHNINTSTTSKWIQNYAKVYYQNEILAKSIDEIVKKYATLDYTMDKTLGNSKYDASEQLENYAEQLVLIQEQYDKEVEKKHTDQDKLLEYEQEEAEIVEKMNDLMNEMVEDIIGGSAEDIAKQLGDAFIEAFETGEDAAQAWGDAVDDIVKDIVKQLLIQEYIEPEIGEIFNKYKDKWFNENGTFVGADEVIDDMAAFSDELNAACGEFGEAWTAISDAMGFVSESTREASQKGIATASQESVDELNGRATAIQGHTFTINQNTILLVQNTNAILQSVMNIDNNTDGLSSRMARVEDYVKELRDTTNDIALKGVKIA